MAKLLSDLQIATMLGAPLTHDVPWVGAKNKDLCLSWSKIEKFNQCPRLFKFVYIDKAIPFDASNPILKWGTDVHKAVEDYLLKGIKLPLGMRQFKDAVDAVRSKSVKLGEQGKLKVPLNGEQEWAMTANGKFTTWFDSKTVFMRNKADLMWGSQSVLYSVDWKTGKGNYPKPEQLELTGLVAKAQPKLAKYETHKSALVFLEASKVVPLSVDMSANSHEQLMHKYLSKGIEIVQTFDEGEWAMKESVLCAWCEDTTCPYNKSRG